MTGFLRWQKMTWILVLWSGYIATWTVVTGPSPAIVAVWWLAGVIVFGQLLPRQAAAVPAGATVAHGQPAPDLLGPRPRAMPVEARRRAYTGVAIPGEFDTERSVR